MAKDLTGTKTNTTTKTPQQKKNDSYFSWVTNYYCESCENNAAHCTCPSTLDQRWVRIEK